MLRISRSVTRAQNLTTLRLVSHISTGVIIGILYWNVGNNGRLIRANSSFLFFSAILMMFAAMIPTIQTCTTNAG